MQIRYFVGSNPTATSRPRPRLRGVGVFLSRRDGRPDSPAEGARRLRASKRRACRSQGSGPCARGAMPTLLVPTSEEVGHPRGSRKSRRSPGNEDRKPSPTVGARRLQTSEHRVHRSQGERAACGRVAMPTSCVPTSEEVGHPRNSGNPRGSKRTRVPWFARSWRFEPRACGPRSAIWRRGREAAAAPFRAASPRGTPPVRENRGVPRDRRSRATPRFEADRGRFELPIRGNPYTAFPMLLLQPLGHLSGCEDGRLV